MCTLCTESVGDVPRIRRFDEYRGEDLVSTHFYKNHAIEAHMHRLNTQIAPNRDYEQAIGDDSHLKRAVNPRTIGGYGLGQIIEPDMEEVRPVDISTARDNPAVIWNKRKINHKAA